MAADWHQSSRVDRRFVSSLMERENNVRRMRGFETENGTARAFLGEMFMESLLVWEGSQGVFLVGGDQLGPSEPHASLKVQPVKSTFSCFSNSNGPLRARHKQYKRTKVYVALRYCSPL